MWKCEDFQFYQLITDLKLLNEFYSVSFNWFPLWLCCSLRGYWNIYLFIYLIWYNWQYMLLLCRWLNKMSFFSGFESCYFSLRGAFINFVIRDKIDVSNFVGTRIDWMTEFFSLFFNLMFMVFYPNVCLYKVSEVRKLLNPLELELKMFGNQHMGARLSRQTAMLSITPTSLQPTWMVFFLKNLLLLF